MPRDRFFIWGQFCGETCYFCDGPKPKFVWLCWPCYQGFLRLPEEDALAAACHPHLIAAAKFFDVVQARKAAHA